MTGPMIFFFALAGLSILFSLMVIFQRNVVHSVMSLVATLFLMAVLFLTLDAPMIGILQILVYAGAIMVLFLFVIMLLHPRVLEERPIFWWGVGSLAAMLLALVIAPPLFRFQPGFGERAPVVGFFGSPEMLGRSLFYEFILPFEIAGILLLVAMVGAVVLARREG